ncbi:hypothetical protein ABH15_11885 [Methanoculleus taiwanensis]|uniref:Uncharacterized protein n=1 Tax=Methanoculleus taiwanensis TaxID=1550565 RepID=A0A498GZQ5_9EURY|nr:hypothetical protein [Methanoculleus taiwanensis]RXE55565.1 hypothetical protein ABH15_11885 [Methanoculleus taiwanensis]
MKRIAWLSLISMLLIVGTASAAYIGISAPDRVEAGAPLIVTGTTMPEGLTKPSLNPGFSTDVVLYYAVGTKQEVARNTIVIQQDGTFRTTFETAGLRSGQYTVEIIDPTKTTFGGSSTTLQFVTIVNRAEEIKLTAPTTQIYDGTLNLAGSVPALGDAGIQIEVSHEAATAFGPAYIKTDKNGAFSLEVPISEGGTYRVQYADYKGFITAVDYTVTGGFVNPTGPTPTILPDAMTASAGASRDSPAYFVIDTKPGQVTVTTSPGIDWVIEYADEDQATHKVNNKGLVEGEEASFTTRGGVVYVKVYPMSYTDSGTVRLTVENAETVQASQTVPPVFGDVPTTTQATPIPVALGIFALLILLVIRQR